jgi:hypothetical protein
VASMETSSFNSLVEHYLGARIPSTLADRVLFAQLPAEARGVIVRLLGLMKRSLCPATEFTPLMMQLLSTVTPGMLPSAWEGRIPPVTYPGRHRKLDAYVARHTRLPSSGQPVFVDLGCGFPPVTTVDTAGCMPDWSVFGVDRSFARYVLFDAEGHYACFDREGSFQYLQAHLKPLHDHPESARDRFKALFADLAPRLIACDDQVSEIADKKGNRLVHNYVRRFEADHLKFIESDIEDLQLPPAHVVRCMNVLLYFEKSVRQRMRLAIGAQLDGGGMLISGFNHPFGIYARYAVYTKEAAGLRPVEFAFSPDNLRPLGVGPWLTLQDEDEEAELLADLTAAIRADRIFWPEFNQRVDALQEKNGICRREEDGYLHFTEEALTAPANITTQKTTALWGQLASAGFTDGAVDALCRAGYTAWKNPVGDIAVLPPEGRF